MPVSVKPIQFFNTLSRQIEVFSPMGGTQKGGDPSPLKIYSCGPTVYNFAHIGNLRSYVFSDLLRRTLKLAGYQVVMAMNLTDVDDKTIKGAYELAKEKKSKPSVSDLKEFTNRYSEFFFQDLAAIGIEKVEFYPRATDSIEAMVDLVQRLMTKGLAYQQDGSIYLSIEKVKNYGRLSGFDLSQVKTGLRYNTDEYEKDDIRDFVLWKAEKIDDISWSTSIGNGRPGWHLECSAMIEKIFQGPIDIHTGGVDLIFPHHENEMAQSCSAYDHPFVKYWLHCEHLLVDNKKMSKSAGNFYTLKDIQQKGFHPLTLRFALLSVHYRQKLNFTLESLKQSENILLKIWHCYNGLVDAKTAEINCEDIIKQALSSFSEFENGLFDDLNIAVALSHFHAFVALVNRQLLSGFSSAAKQTLLDIFARFDSVLNLLAGAASLKVAADFSDSRLNELLSQRELARTQKDFQKSDEIRDQLRNLGYLVKDSKDGQKLEKIL